MALARNLIGGEVKGSGRAGTGAGLGLTALGGFTGMRDVISAAGQPAAPAKTEPAAPAPEKTTEAPAVMTFNPAAISAATLADLKFDPGIRFPPMVFTPAVINKSTTQLAQGAIRQLIAATPAVVQEAIRTITNKRIAANQLLSYLERRTRVGEVLNDLAQDWDQPTPQDFAEAFQMPATADKFPVMDAIVSISILNDPDLRSELEAENTAEPSTADLMENRRIVWQWPEPGTPFTPPYVIVVAVERHDTREAQNIIQSILGDLVEFQGFKLPRDTVRRLS